MNNLIKKYFFTFKVKSLFLRIIKGTNSTRGGGVLGQDGLRGCSAGQGTFFNLHESQVGSQKHQNIKISPS